MTDEEKYPWITKLKIPIHYEDETPYVLGKDIRKVLNKKQMNKYCAFFGVQTGILTKDGKCGSYPHDVDAVLHRIFTGELTGTQHPYLWD